MVLFQHIGLLSLLCQGKKPLPEGGKVEKAEKWDRRKLAYEINGHKEGNYVVMLFEAEPSLPHELDRQMRISDDVIRHRIFLREE